MAERYQPTKNFTVLAETHVSEEPQKRGNQLQTPAGLVVATLPLPRQGERFQGITEKHKPRAAVIGAGVIGLTNALLAQQEGYEVTVYADLPSSKTTSMIAGATFAAYSVPLTEQVFRMTENSKDDFEALARNTEQTGVRKINYWEIESKAVDLSEKPYLQVMEDVQVHEGSQVPGGYKQGIRYGTFAMDMPIYLPHLVEKFRANGGKFIKRKFSDMQELAEIETEIVFNCTGLGARELAKDMAVKPIKGQLAIIDHRPELTEAIKHDGFYAFPQPQTNRTVLGGTTVLNFDESVEPGVTQTIVNGNKRIFPNLTENDVKDSLVGLRPYREGDVRVEAEDINGKLIVHNYGHGGAGVTLSWGSGKLALSKYNF